MTETAIDTSLTSSSTIILRIHQWREKHISERMFVLILAFLVGFFSAVAAFVLHWFGYLSDITFRALYCEG